MALESVDLFQEVSEQSRSEIAQIAAEESYRSEEHTSELQ